MSDTTNLHELTKKELQVEARMRDVQFQQSWTAARILQELKEVATQKDYKLHCPKVTTLELELKNLQVAREVLQEYFETCVEQPTSHRKVRLREQGTLKWSKITFFVFITNKFSEICSLRKYIHIWCYEYS